jgi:NAD+ synthase
MKRSLRLTLAQLNPTVGDIDGNAARMLDVWEKCHATSDLVVFPELCLSGYPPEDLAHNALFLAHNYIDGIARIIAETKNDPCSIVIPTLAHGTDGQYYNTLMVCQAGEERHFQEKVALPNYGVFDEKRIFSSGYYPKVFEINGIKIGFLICEDLWNDVICTHLKNEGAEILISINGSPYDYQKQAQRIEVARHCVEKTGLSLVYLNMVGGQDDLVFDGNSFIMHANGQIVHWGHSFGEDVFQTTVVFENDFVGFEDTQSLSAPPQDHPPFHADFSHAPHAFEIYHAIKLGLRDYVQKNGFSKVLLGLSGGIDSALVAAIAVDALGAENVRAIMLPSEFTSQDSLDDAAQCAKNLGIKYEIISIQDAVKTFEKIIPNLKGLAHENSQSRIRGLILMALSNMSGEMLLSTGNKSELATGYATLYGDMNGGYNPLKDVYKTEVYRLAERRNKESRVIPERIITKAPSAELRPDQKDQDSLPPYDVLDKILRALVEHDHVFWPDAQGEMAELRDFCLEHQDDVKKVARLLKNSEFKRRQSCPGPKISPQAFGKDRRYPITNKFLNRIEKP